MRIGASRLFMPDNNRIEQDHRRIKRRVRPMLGFQSPASAAITLSGIEMVQMMRK
jgi:putative transposase